jgi:hypothetical protein
MAPEPLKQPDTIAFPAKKLASLMWAIADPEGKGELSAEQAAAIRTVESNLARREDSG